MLLDYLFMSVYGSYSDRQLTALLKEGDHLAFQNIYERYWGILYNHSYRILQDQDLTKDVIQDVFMMLWTKRDDLEPTKSLSSFLYTSVKNRTLNQIDHSKVREVYIYALQNSMDEGLLSTDDFLEEKELAKRIEAELACLPTKMRKIFELSRMEGFSYKQIATQLNVTDHTVRKQVSNALKILRAKLTVWFL